MPELARRLDRLREISPEAADRAVMRLGPRLREAHAMRAKDPERFEQIRQHNTVFNLGGLAFNVVMAWKMDPNVIFGKGIGAARDLSVGKLATNARTRAVQRDILAAPSLEGAKAAAGQYSSLADKLRAQGAGSVDVRTSIDAVAAAVGRERPDFRRHAAPDGRVTLMFSDMEGFTEMTERLGDREAHRVIQTHNGIVREQLGAHGGVEVGVQGDGFLIAFSDARHALRCAIAIQRARRPRAARRIVTLRPARFARASSIASASSIATFDRISAGTSCAK